MKAQLMIVAATLLIASSALAKDVSYNCKMLSTSHGLVFDGKPIQVKISAADKITVRVQDEFDPIRLTGKSDPAYIARDNSGRTWMRFRPLKGAPEGEMMVVTESKILEGKESVLFKLQWRGEAFYQDVYVCRPAAAR